MVAQTFSEEKLITIFFAVRFYRWKDGFTCGPEGGLCALKKKILDPWSQCYDFKNSFAKTFHTKIH
jgi:hypothetical protein